MLNETIKNIASKELRIKIAKRLHDERKLARYSLDELARNLNLSKPTVQCWEKGWKDGTGQNTIPSMDQLLDLSSLYKCTPEYLLCEYDQKTRQETDVCFETGLLPESYNMLHKCFSLILEQPIDQSGYYHIMFQFLNHLINNAQSLADALYYRVIVENINRRFDTSQYKELILEGFHAVSINRKDAFSIMNGDIASNIESMLYTQPMMAYYESKGIDSDTIANIMIDFQANFKAISSNKKSKANFELTECFMELINSFLASYPNNVDTFKDFADKIREAHIDEINVKPLNIIY